MTGQTYEFLCPYCGNYTNVDTTGDIPKEGEKVECMACNGKSEIIFSKIIFHVVAILEEMKK